MPDGLRLYVGSTSQDDGGYGAKVMAERSRLRDIAHGRKVPINAPQAPATVTASTSGSQPAANNGANGKRVQMTLDGGHPLAAAKPAPPTTPAQDDASAVPVKHVVTPELGA